MVIDVSKFSVFHAAMIAPLWKLDWRLGFLLAAFFFAAGAFVVRNWLRRENLDGEWTALYFFLFGALYYTQSLLSAVPAAVAGLFGVSLLLRERPRPTAGGSDAGRERVVASVDGTVCDREHGSLAVGKSAVRSRRKSKPIDCGSARADCDAGRL